ncbi:hypothetical protein PT2222_50109 [Paraburkholderia tropica]
MIVANATIIDNGETWACASG